MKKVKCISNDFDFIRYGEVYDVKEESEYCYKIVNDEGCVAFYIKGNFEMVEENKEESNKEHKFKIGDRIRTLKDISYLVKKGVEGTIIDIECGGDLFVEWDKAEDDRRWYANPNEVELLESKKENNKDLIDEFFNWEAFKNGKLCVNCDTKEKAEDFLKKCHERGLRWLSNESLSLGTKWEDEKEETVYCHFREGITYDSYDYIKTKKKVDIIKWEIKEEGDIVVETKVSNGIEISKDGISVNGELLVNSKGDIEPIKIDEGINFTDVINHILEGQTWSDGTLSITKEEDAIVIKTEDNTYIFTNDYREYRLQKLKEEVSFIEAFELYEQGKEIESLYSGDRYIKDEDGDDMIWDEDRWILNDYDFSLGEIRGEWYINE